MQANHDRNITASKSELPRGSMASRMHNFVTTLQSGLCEALEEYEPESRFRSDSWKRPGGGGGLTCVLEGGEVFEKGGVNTSSVFGDLPERIASVLGVGVSPFFATGLSLVLHPRSPFIPTVHANFRYFALGENLKAPDDQWFGGGADLTPYYPYLADVQHFHRTWKRVCDSHDEIADYTSFKSRCDDYFYLPHRKETRGVGGIFYDYIREDPDAAFAFSTDAGHAFANAYLPIVERRMSEVYTDEQKKYHELRRGRYVEFNLLFDRGTRFGIETDGRTESILMSLPARVKWQYDWKPQDGTKEANAAWFFRPRDWLNLTEEDVGKV